MKTVLVIDDEENIRKSLAGILKDEGYAVLSEGSGEAGFKAFTEKSPNAVLLDVWLPDGDGAGILEKMTGIDRKIPVIMISGHSDIDTAIKTIKLGAYDFIEKPLSLERIIKKTIMAGGVRDSGRPGGHELIGESAGIKALKEKILKAAPSSAPVLISGENGTGKELVARALHLNSLRSEEPFIAINCAAIPEELIESEIFGYEKGAFTGAGSRKRGKFELADGGTIFLDEIGDMSLRMQSKILRVLQEGRFQRVGGETDVEADVRVIAATNKDLEAGIADGSFRKDLFYRLNVIPLLVPPLRERKEDIPLLADYFAGIFGGRPGALSIDENACAALEDYSWPGNVRELKNIIERFSILNRNGRISEEDVRNELKLASESLRSFHSRGGKEFCAGGGSKADAFAESRAKEDFRADASGGFMKAESFKEARESFEKEYLVRKIEENGGNITKTAMAIGMSRRNLQKRMHCLNINQ